METASLDLLALFAAVARTGSFSEAARNLSLPKSTVSRGISSLEREMGVRLLHRTTRQVSLSTAGAALYEKVAPLLIQLESALADLPELEEQPSGKLRITAPVDFGAAVLPDIIASFTARYPAIEIELRITNEVVDLVADGYDLAMRISARPLKSSSMTARSAGPITLQLFASPAYLARRGTPRSPRDVASHEWVAFRGWGSIQLDGPGQKATVEPHGRVTCDDMFFARELLRRGSGIGILPTFLAEKDVAAGRLVRVLPKWNTQTGQLWLMWPGSRQVPRKVTAFKDFVLEAMAARKS